MGSQTLEILRQGVWASLTGGWFYDPHQNVFCNAVHLYIWLFLLCGPFITYLYFPKTFTTWGVYCFTTAFTITVLKIVNMALHILYDKAQNSSELNLKKPVKGTRENRGEDDCGIEMQVMGADVPSQASVEQPINEASGANSMISIDCQDQVTSTIDLKVDVHRKNSSESSDSVGLCHTSGPSSYRVEVGKIVNQRKSLKVKSKSEERPAKNPVISEEIGLHASNRITYDSPSTSQLADDTNDASKPIRMEDKRKSCLERQSSFDVSEASVLDLSLARQQSVHICCDIDVDNFTDVISKRGNHKSSKLQRHRSSESNDERHRRNRNLFRNNREQLSGNDIRNHIPSLASDLYLESNYAKSDLGIERIETNNSKIYLLQRSKPMRKDSNSTMSALHLPMTSGQSNNTRKRRHSNSQMVKISNQMMNFRRIKSAALELNCPQPSVSNLCPHPNSAEAIPGQQIKNPQNSMLPPPSKCLVRNAHLNLCPKIGNNSGGIITDPVYPIAEQADEKSLNEAFIFSGELDSEGEGAEKVSQSQRKRCSTTESESDLERPRTHSTDSETDNNGSRSPLLNKVNRHSDKYKSPSEDAKQGLACSASNFSVANDNNLMARYKNGDSGCPSSDCEQTSASSKDMLLSKDQNEDNKFKRWSAYSDKGTKASTAPENDAATGGDNLPESEGNCEKKVVKEAKQLGAIPKTSARKDDHNDYDSQKRTGAVPKSTSRTSSSASSRSFSAESFSNEIYKSYKDQWLMVGGAGHSQAIQSALAPSCMHNEIMFTNYPRRTFIDSSYRFQTKMRRSSEGARRIRETDTGSVKLEEISRTLDFGSDELQNAGNGTLSIQGLMNEHYSFENAITTEQRPSTGQILNISGVEFSDPVCCDYWKPCSLSADKPMQPKRFYKYRFGFFGRRELKISMDRLQLLALFDRDLNWFHVILAIILSTGVCLLGSTILQMDFYKDIFAFIFCAVIAGSQYSLLKSVQPDAASPIHGFNKTVAYSRPIYFCLCSGLLVMSQHLALEFRSNETWSSKQFIGIFGVPFSPELFLDILTNIMSIILLLLPIFFSLGLFPQINTFCMYFLEQVDMHVFGGSAACSLAASLMSVLKSLLAICILYGPAYGGLLEEKGTQHVLFSIFCSLLIPIAYHMSRTASDFTHVWSLIKSSIISYPEDEDDEEMKTTNAPVVECKKPNKSTEAINDATNEETEQSQVDSNDEQSPNEMESPDPLPKKLQQTVNTRLKNDLVVSSALAVIIFGLHCSTVFTVLQPDLNTVLYSIAGILGFFLHYMLPQMRKHLPWLCFSRPILRQNEFGRFEVSEAAKIMWFEVVYVCLCFLERNVLYPLIFISAITADSSHIVQKFGTPFGVAIVCICALKCVRSVYSDVANQYLILIFAVLLFKIDFYYASETFLVDYFVVSIIYRKSCDFLLKLQFIVTYIAPWQITWGSAFHAFAQPFSVPHSAMLFMQAGISSILSTPLNPFLGSAIFLTSYARPIKFWERDYNTRRIDHSNTRLSSQLERDLGADDNNLNSIFYEHLTRSLQHSLCGDLLLGRWGQVNQGDCFVLASDYLNCLVHIIELGNGLCTFQMRGLEFRGTYCQQREVEAISEGVENNEACCCCSPGHLPRMLSANAMFSTRWLAWQVVAAQYVLEGYSISENLATATLQVFEFRKVLITYYVKSIIYYVIRNSKLEEWLTSASIQDTLTNTLNRQFVDLDPIFNYNLDEDFDFRALGITRTSYCSIYMGWIQFCYAKRKHKDKNSTVIGNETRNGDDSHCHEHSPQSSSTVNVNDAEENYASNGASGVSGMSGDGNSPNVKDKNTKPNKFDENENSAKDSIVTKDSPLVSLCLALGLLARRTLATASHSSLSGVEFFLHGLHALFKGDFRITSPRDEWVFADMELLHGVVAPAVKMALKLHQDHFSSPDEYLDPAVLYEAITTHSKDLVISHEADPMWRSAVLRGAPNLLALRHVMEDGSDEYRIIRLTKRFLNFRVIKLNRECVRGLWAGQQQELIYLRNRNPERGSIQNAKQALRNIINSSCDQPIGYPIYVSPLTTSYAETNEQLCRIIGGSITLDTIRTMILDCWTHIRQRCREGCSSGSGGFDCETTNEVPGVYFSPAAVNNTSATLPYGSQSLSCAGTRGSLASMNKPTSSTLIAGFLNRERDQERETVRERSNKKNAPSRSERERRATLPIASSAASESSKDLTSFKDGMGSTNSELRHADMPEISHSTKMFCSSGNLGAEGLKCISSESPRRSNSEYPRAVSHEKDELPRTIGMDASHLLIELNKKVIIVDGTEIYDCLDLGRRIDVVWPNEKMRACGGRSSWKEWSPKEGMVGYVVHYWQPNHHDQRFRSSVNRTLYLIEIGERFVPVGESGIREYNQVPDNARSYSSAVDNPTNDYTTLSTDSIDDIPIASRKPDVKANAISKDNYDYSKCDNNNQTDISFNDDEMLDDDQDNVESESSASSVPIDSNNASGEHLIKPDTEDNDKDNIEMSSHLSDS